MLVSELLGRPSQSLGLQFRAVAGMFPTTIQNSIGFSDPKVSYPRMATWGPSLAAPITDVLRQY